MDDMVLWGCDRMCDGIERGRKGAVVFACYFLWPPVLHKSHYHSVGLLYAYAYLVYEHSDSHIYM